MVVSEFGGLQKFEGKEPEYTDHGTHDRHLHGGRPQGMVRQPVVPNFHKRNGGQHSEIDYPVVELKSERGFLCRPTDVAYAFQEGEDLFQYPFFLDDECRDGHGSEDLAYEENGAVVVLRAESHGDVDNDVPERDQRREVVEEVVGVHHVCQDDGEQVQPDHDLATSKHSSDVTELRYSPAQHEGN